MTGAAVVGTGGDLPAHGLVDGQPWHADLAVREACAVLDVVRRDRDADEVAGYVAGLRALGPDARAMVDGVSAERLIPDLKKRIGKCA